MLHVPGLYILHTEEYGRGVYTSEVLEAGDIIELCPIIKIPKGELEWIDKTKVYDYYFIWEEEGYDACLALGYGSLYNHSPSPNAEVIMDYVDQRIKMVAATMINSGDQIFIDYTGGTKGQIELWFDVV